MAFGMFSGQSSPIAIDFGSSSVKLLQIGQGDKPELIAAAEIPLPDAVRSDVEKANAFLGEHVPRALRDGKFRGKRAVIAVPSSQTLTSHMQIADTEGLSRDEALKAQLQVQMNVMPQNVVVRSVEVCPVHRQGQARTEMICFAIAKDTVMRYVDLLRKCNKMEVVGVHTETLALLRAFDHVTRRAEDASVTTLYVDLGWSGTRIAIAHGQQLVFARFVSVGGRQFDQVIAGALKCDIGEARRMRLAVPGDFAVLTRSEHAAGAHADAAPLAGKAGGTAVATRRASRAAPAEDRRTGAVAPALRHGVRDGAAPRKIGSADIGELLDILGDEIAMCLRYHTSLFRGRPIDRTILLGGEARQAWMAQHVARTVGVPARLGDPVARFDFASAPSTPGFTPGQPQPGWAVACGLCSAPTDL